MIKMGDEFTNMVVSLMQTHHLVGFSATTDSEGEKEYNCVLKGDAPTDADGILSDELIERFSSVMDGLGLRIVIAADGFVCAATETWSCKGGRK